MRRPLHIFFLLFSLCGLTSFLQGQNQPFVFRTITSEDGLQNDNIYSLHQDHAGFIWIGTENGLHRFDGVNFTLFEHDPERPSSIAGNVIFKILEDQQHNLYFCTNAGFEQFDPLTNTFIHIPSRIQSGKSTLLNYGMYIPTGMVDRNNQLYISDGSNGIYKLRRDSMFFEKLSFHNQKGNEIEMGIITSMMEDSKGKLWMGSKSKGVFMVNRETRLASSYSLAQKTLNSDNVYSLYEDKQGNILVGTNLSLNRLEPNGNTFVPYATGAAKQLQSAYVIEGDKKENLWIGTNGEGLVCIDPTSGEKKYYEANPKNKNSLSSNFIRVIYEDNQGNLWIGTQQGGLNCRIKNNMGLFRSFRKTESGRSLTFNSVDAIVQDPAGNFWIGTDGGGLNYFDPKQEKFTSYQDIVPMRSVLALMIDHRQELWAGGYLEGLYRINPKTKKIARYSYNSKDSNSLGHDDVRSILEDSKGNLWVATNGGGLNKLDQSTNRFQRLNVRQHHLTSNYCITLFEDSKHRIWLGTYSGFNILDLHGKVLKSYRVSDKKGLSGNWIYCFYQDSKGRYWVGTDYGLNLFDEAADRFTSFLKKDGLPNNVIAGILEDSQGFLWISTNGGLAKFDPEKKLFTNFNNKDGLPGNLFNHGAYYKSTTGNLLFGSTNGLLLFQPTDITINHQAPPVHITDLLLADTSYAIPSTQEATLRLKYKDASFINFKFSALNFINPEKNQYQYFLEGFDKDWSNASNRQSATYTNLAPGSYTFHVKASNNDGIWNEKGAQVILTIVPPYYRTLWAYLVYFLIAAGLLYFFIRYALIKATHRKELEIEKVKREKTEEISALKTNFFTNISHELSTPLSLILAPLQQMREKASFDPRLAQISWNNTRRLQKLVKELLDLHKIEEGKEKLLLSKTELHSFISALAENFKNLFEEKNIEFRLELKTPIKEVYLDQEKIEKILGNLLSNACKYTSPGGIVTLEVSESIPSDFILPGQPSSGIYFVVRDNGIGIESDKLKHLFDKYYRVLDNPKEQSLTQATGYGIGLYYTQTLATLHQGSIHVQSTPGKGSSFLVYLPDHLKPSFEHPEEKTENSTSRETEPAIIHSSEDNEEALLSEDSESTILIVEDNPELNEVIAGILSDQHKILCAYDGQEGWKLACRHHPDVIITDIMMPKLDGIGLCEKIKKDFDTCHIPVIMLTALNTDEYKLKGIEHGADDYVTKPFNPKILSTRVSALIESRRMLQKKFLHHLKVSPQEITVSSTDEKFLQDCIIVVEKYMENPEFDTNQFCKAMNMSESGLYRKIKAITSQSPNQFIRTIRLKRAAQLLENSQLSVSEVCYQVGFSDVKYFRKCFQKQFGSNPSTFNTKEE